MRRQGHRRPANNVLRKLAAAGVVQPVDGVNPTGTRLVTSVVPV